MTRLRLIPLRMALVAILLNLISPQVLASAAVCKPETLEGLNKVIADQKITHLVFFASWCSACKHDLEQKYESPIFIATFDTLANASKAFASIASVSGKTCYFDTDNAIAKAFDIGGLPFIKELKPR